MQKSIAAVLALSAAAFCFDGQRKGFVLGGGAGGSLTSYNQEVTMGGNTATSDQENAGGFATNFVIGYGVSNTLLVNYFAHTNWFSLTNVNNDDVTIANGNAGIQVVKYLVDGGENFVPSPYVYGGLGWSTWTTPFEDNGASWMGGGLSVGAGYEFAKHWAVQLGVFFTNPSDEENGVKAQSNSMGFHLQIFGLAY